MENTPKHTPGPWGYVLEESADTSCFLISDGETPIARVNISGARPLSELRANARLIASAPSLVEENARLRETVAAQRVALENAASQFDYTVAAMAQGHTVSVSSLQNCAAQARNAAK